MFRTGGVHDKGRKRPFIFGADCEHRISRDDTMDKDDTLTRRRGAERPPKP